MDAKKIIDAVGGRKQVMQMTELTRGRIYQWISENHIPDPWLKMFEAKFPDLDWESLRATHKASGKKKQINH